MPENPFRDQSARDEALKTAADDVAKSAAESVDAEEGGPEAADASTTDVSPLFGEDPEADAEAQLDALEAGEAPADGDDEAAGDGLFGETTEDKAETTEDKPKGEKPVSQKVFQKRISKLAQQRREAREEAAAAREKAARLEGTLAAYGERYSKWEKEGIDPATQARWDADFMDAAEELSKNDPTLAAAMGKVKEYLDTGRKSTVSDKITTPTFTADPTNKAAKSEADSKETARDPAVEKLVRRGAEAEITSTLKELGVKDSFGKVLRNHIVNASGVDLTDLDRDTVVKLSRKFISENGFTEEDVLRQSAKGKSDEKTSKGKKAPATTSGKAGKAAEATKSKEESGGEASDKTSAPKTRDEWEAEKESRIQSFARTFGELAAE